MPTKRPLKEKVEISGADGRVRTYAVGHQGGRAMGKAVATPVKKDKGRK